MESKFKIDSKITEQRDEKFEEFINKKLWRPKITQQNLIKQGSPDTNQALKMYDFKQAQKIEDKIYENNIEKLRLPLLSQEAIYCVQID